MKKSTRHRGPSSGKPDRRLDRRPDRRQDRRQPRLAREVSVLYEDDAVVALNKPAKLLAVPAENSGAPSALSLLAEALKERRQRALVVHRIDRYTSGILLFAEPWKRRQ